MNTNARREWTKNEEYDLIKDIITGSKIDDSLASKFGRSSNALEMRLQKIIYELITLQNISVPDLSKQFNISENDINTKFYAYKNYLDKKQNNLEKKTNSTFTIQNPIVPINTTLTAQIQHPINSLPNIVPQSGGLKDKITKFENNLSKQNNLMRLIIENKQLSSKINKMVKSKQLDKSVKKAIKKCTKN